MKWTFATLCWLMAVPLLMSQPPANPTAPIDGIVEKTNFKDRRVLPYPAVREADILWEKRIWRMIDTRQLMNRPFRYPEQTFFEILQQGILDNQITAYSTEDDKFSKALSPDALQEMLYQVDTVRIIDPVTYEETLQPVYNSINPEDIVYYRVKEVWYFDSKYSTMKVRLLGIAPIIDQRDDRGEVAYRKPLFWVYYPHCREYLAQFQVFNPGNDAAVMSWEDHLEMRYFDSYVIKESNVYDRRLEDYLSGRDLLLEGEKIEEAIFNKEQDMWSN